MRLAETFLPKLGDWGPAGEGRPTATFPLPDHGWTVRLTADRVDTVGCWLTEIDVTRDAPITADSAALEAHARTAAGRVTGLLEALRLVEVDRVGQVALLRSDAPPAAGDAVLYYEVRFEGLNRVTVRRFRAAKASPAKKEPVAFALTHEALAKLVDDLVRD